MVACVKLETRYSKYDQENVMELKKKWEADANVKFVPKGCRPKLEELIDRLESVGEEDWENIDEIPFPDMANIEVESKLVFVYQSANMQRLYRKYAPHLVLLDATYKVCKYSLPLFLLVVQLT